MHISTKRDRTKGGMHFDAESGKLPIPAMNKRIGCKRLILRIKKSMPHRNACVFRRARDLPEVERRWLGTSYREISNNDFSFLQYCNRVGNFLNINIIVLI